ncbi:MAG: hypothetical protein ABI574_02265 [Burkholderiales bacterium]
MSDQSPVRQDVDADGVATLTLNRPDQLNAFDLKMIEAPDAELMTATYELARTIASKPQQAVRFFRRAVCQSQSMALATHLDMVSSHMAVLEDPPEHRAGIAAFRARARGAK